jgi:hypothetical protein
MTPPPPEQPHASSGAGNLVTGSTISGSPLTAVSGDSNRVVITNQPTTGISDDAVLAALRAGLSAELAEIRELLLKHHDPARATDREDAIEAVTALQTDLAKPELSDRKTLRQRIKGLIGTLKSVAEIIGGIAALEAIVRGL